MIKNRVDKNKKQKGFTMIELLYSLLITGTISLIGYSVWNDVYKKIKLNSDIDALSANENVAVKYVMDQNKTIINLLKSSSSDYVALPLDNITSLTPNYQNIYSTKFAPQSFSSPCLIITRDTSNEVLKGYLFWNNISTNKKNLYTTYGLNYIISHKFTSELVNKNSTSLNTKTNTNANAQTLLNIIQNNNVVNNKGCNLTVNNNSILIDLTKNSNFSMVRDLTTDSSGNVDVTKTSEALTANESAQGKSNQSVTTNLYFDAVVKESAPYTNYYCDNTQAKTQYQADIQNICVQYEQQTGNFFDGQPRITANNQIGQQCEYSVSGIFSGRTETNWMAASSMAELNSLGASYISIGCKWASSNGSYLNPTNVFKYCAIPFDYSNQLYPNRTCKYGVTYSCYINGSYKEYTSCEDDANRVNMFHQQGCGFVSRWSNGMYRPGETGCSSDSLAHGGIDIYGDNIICKIGGNTSHEDACGKFTKDAFQDSGVTPPVHKFQSLKVGNKASIGSGTPNGSSMSTNANIKVSNAGIQSGYIFLRSQPITADSGCLPEDLGKIYQQTNVEDKFLGSQVICTYDPDFCGGSGYCYSPLVAEAQVVAGNGAKKLYCPVGTIIDRNSKIYDQANLEFNGNCLIYQKDGKKYTGVVIDQSTCPNRSIREINCINSGMVKNYTNCKGGINGQVTCS